MRTFQQRKDIAEQLGRWLWIASIVACLVVVAYVLAGCGDNEPPDVHILTKPDAAIDAPPVPPDACVREPTTEGCCALLPDEEAARSCAAEGLDDGCGHLVCWQADCTLTQITFCSTP